MPNATFNPQEFFIKTAHYASQGRGLFKLTKPVPVLTNQGSLVDMGWSLLSSGIVAKSVSMPGYNLATFEEFSYIGPTRKHAHTQIFGSITVEFLLIGSSLEEAKAVYHTFLVWQEKIAGARWGANESDRGAVSDSTFFAIEYYDDYVSEADVQVFPPTISPKGADTLPSPIIHNKYREIYPQALGGLTTSWDSQDSPLSLSVTFEFFHTNSQIR